MEKDFYLRRKMDEKGFLPIHLIATFPRVKTMTQDYAVVLSAIESSSSLELSEPEKKLVRSKTTPEKWPLRDITPAAPVPAVIQHSNLTPSNSSGAQTPSDESLNPNVPEFVPKALPTTPSPPPSKETTDEVKTEQEDKVSETNNVNESSLEESWKEVKRKPKPVVNKDRKRSSLSFSSAADAPNRDYLNSEELAFQFEEDTLEYSARGRNFSSSRYSL